MNVTHYVPLVMLSTPQVNELQPPKLPAAHVRLRLPPLKEMRVATERMKSICETVSIECTEDGKMVWSGSVPTVNIDNNQHSPNENLRLGNFLEGIAILMAVLSQPAP